MIPLPFPKARAMVRAPTRSQLIAIEVSLTRKTRETARLDTKVTRLKNRLAVLVNERKLLNEAIETHDPPINKLSPEVLQEIFVLCLPVAHNAVMSARQAPLLLCRVCHGWRQLALATPRLWTSIHIPLCNDMTIVPMPSPDDVNSWLSRSKSLPLSISFWCYPSAYCSGVTQYQSYLDGITSVESRWKSLHISTTEPDVLKYVLSGDGVPGSLEELCIDSTSLPNMDELEDADSDSEGSLPPNLKSLSLPFDALILFRLNADYKTLTQLGITRPDHGTYEVCDLIEVLPFVPLLRSLSISGFHSSFPIESSPLHCTIHFADLESLSITNYQPYSCVWMLLRALHTPVLRHWKYFLLPSHDGCPIKEHLNSISIFLRRLKEPLEELDLLIHSYGTEFRRLLGLLPGLKRLSLEKPRSTGPFWFANEGVKNIGDFHLKCLIEDSHLIWEGDSDHASYTDEDDEDTQIEPPPDPMSDFHCPQLEVIKCVCRGQALSDDGLLDFLRVRTGSRAKTAEITSLKKVEILTESPISDGLQEKVNQILDGTGTLFRLFSSPVVPPPYIPLESPFYPSYQSSYNPTF